MPRKKSRIDNPEIVPFALFQLNGAGEFVDVEDIFDRCYQLAPERFGWRKYPYPNYKILSKALRDIEGKDPSLLLKTPDGLKRQLSAKAIQWVRDRLPEFKEILGVSGINPPTRRTGQKLLNEFRDHPLTRGFLEGAELQLVKHQVADLLLCSPDSPAQLWKERLESYRSAATLSNRADLVRFLEFIEKREPSWFGG